MGAKGGAEDYRGFVENLEKGLIPVPFLFTFVA